MKTVLVTGSDGMLGSELSRHLKRRKDIRTLATTLETLDVTDLRAVRDLLHRERPDHIFHCAAYTQVDSAEKEIAKVFLVNSEGTKNVAFFARETGAEMIYMSTDYVFDGEKSTPYTENDSPSPINVYGASKARGEEYVRILCERHKIVRTSWLNGLGGQSNRNFIETMLRFAETRNTLSIVSDQVGSPTFTFDLAPCLITLLDVHAYGTFHITSEGECSWFEFARKVFELAHQPVSVRPVKSDQFRSVADRPRYSVLANKRFESLGLQRLRPWEEGLRDYFRRRRLAESLIRAENRAPSPDAKRA